MIGTIAPFRRSDCRCAVARIAVSADSALRLPDRREHPVLATFALLRARRRRLSEKPPI